MLDHVCYSATMLEFIGFALLFVAVAGLAGGVWFACLAFKAWAEGDYD